MTDNLRAEITEYLRRLDARVPGIVVQSHVIAQHLGADHRRVCEALIELQDSDEVLMRNGWYRLSERARRAS